ncbi:hypothetical protein [Paenibacillus sp. 453mf]|uniref:hypothetical protein n=1 Tax=Paenibacillus sp. 453mf TaxID=1761874 RepID=UPI0008E836EE|nr:hypothetical protein [Paenibacillus sp. 453mf]SFS47704.1 hypothetical protein SAMN04488601_101942 [Paenibacillus sp. 453mf]
MAYVFYEPYKEGYGTVTYIYFTVPQEELGNYVEVDEVPGPENLAPDLTPIQRIDITNKTIFYEYVSNGSLESKVKGLQGENTALNEELGSLLMQSAVDKATM